jgi:hypothetical protein
VELYDHEADPEETHDVSGQPEHAAVIANMQKHLQSLPAWPQAKARQNKVR